MHLKNLTYDLETKLYWKCITVNNPHQELFLHEKVLYIWPAHLQSGASSEILILRSSIGKRYCEPNIDIEVVDETKCCCSLRTSRLGDGRQSFASHKRYRTNIALSSSPYPVVGCSSIGAECWFGKNWPRKRSPFLSMVSTLSKLYKDTETELPPKND